MHEFLLQGGGASSLPHRAAGDGDNNVQGEAPAQIEFIGHDSNTHAQPLAEPEVRTDAAGLPLPFEAPVKAGTPDTKSAYQALAAVESLQQQLM